MTYTLPHLSVISGKCHWPGCGQMAIEIATASRLYWRDTEGAVGLYCADHGRDIASTDNPEYLVNCPNCGCHFGVN